MRPHIEFPISTLREMLSVDEATGILTWLARPQSHFTSTRGQSVFNARFVGQACGSPEGNGYLQCRITLLGKCRLYKAHRIVWALVHGVWPVDQIDHRNCDRTDNRPSNLREATNTENQLNRPVSRISSTGVKGVRFDARRGLFLARINLRGVETHLGRFATLEEASEVRRDAAERIHGEFARA